MAFKINNALLAMTALAMMTACTGTKDEETKRGQSSDKPPEPVTITLYARTLFPDNDFDTYLVQPIKKRFPHITINKIDNTSWNKTSGRSMEELIAAREIPDLIWEGLTNIAALTQLDIPADLTPLAKKHGFDLNVFDPKMLDSIKAYSEKGEVYYFPFNILTFALHYNKDIFDKFGVPYPKDNMTWDDVIELGKKLNRLDNGIQYRGLDMGAINRLQTQMSLPFVDPKTERSLIQSDGWKKFYDMYLTAYQKPDGGYFPYGAGRNAFLKDRTLAMYADILLLGNADLDKATGEGLNWDVVSYPTFKDKPGIGVGVFSDGYVIPKGSKNPDTAFQILSYLASEEVQLAATKNGKITSLNKPDIRKHLFENLPLGKGKNLAQLFVNKYPNTYPMTRYDKTAMDISGKYIGEALKGTKDINSILRQAEEDINKAIDAEKRK